MIVMVTAWQRRLTCIAAAVLALGAAGGPAWAATWNWQKRTPLGAATYGLGAAFVGGRLYAISGFVSARVEAYDPTVDAWSSRTAMPRFLQYFGTASVGSTIYVVGGDTGGSGPVGLVYAYDTTTNSWSTRAPLPAGARWALGAAAI